MKRILALLLVAVMCVSLAACGSKEPQADIIWVDIYSNTVLTLNSDNTLTIGNNSGTWSKEGNCITICYTADGEKIERYLDEKIENDISTLVSQNSGKNNGQTWDYFPQSIYCPEDKVEELKATVLKSKDDTVSTDIIELTVHNAELSYYAEGAATSTSTGKTTNVEEACSPNETGGFYTASKGRTLVCLDFTIKNTDRNSLYTNDYIVGFRVIQNGQYAVVRGYDVYNPEDGCSGLNLTHCPISENGGAYITCDTINSPIGAGETLRIKTVGIIGFEAKDLSAPFDLVVAVKNSSGYYELFIYGIE